MYGMIMGDVGEEDIYSDSANYLLRLAEYGLVSWEVVPSDGTGTE